ncbi:interferon-induced very large GTPase 1-like [Mytilus trossulus]|uniref:interferon-induced very large GTPase 1-like n=1 Tax=Mytilus trossulus TaxID=6551 RepID=UPI003007DC67
MATCDTFADVLSLLELESYWPCKISLRHVFAANLNKTLELKDIKWHILNKIISVDLRARDEVLSTILEMINNQVKQTDTKTKLNQPKENETKRKQRRQRKLSLFHPQDVLNAIYVCCSPFLKQIIVSKLFLCRIAVPVIIQSKQITAGFFWPFDFVATEGTKSTGKCIEGFLSDQDIQIVSFIRLHRTNFSKSDFLNNVLSKDPFFHTFYSRNSPLGTNSKRILEGTVEASQFVPFGKKKTDNFDDVVLFLNLRGDAQEYPLLVDVIKSVSNVVVVLLQTMELLNDDKALEFVTSIYNTSASIIVALESSSDSKSYDEEDELIEKLATTAKNAKCEFHCIELKADGNFRGMDEIVKETKSDILRCLANTKYIRLSTFSSVVEKSGLPCDFASTECISGCQNAEKLYCLIDAKSTPIQQLWIKLSQLKKKKYRERDLQTKRDIEKQIHQTRTEQQNHISNIPKMSLAMLQNLFELKDSPHRLMFFLKHLKLLLDKRSKKILPNLLTMYNDLSIGSKKEGSNNDQLELQIKRIKIEIEEASFGVEHLMREVAQIFEAFTYAPEIKRYNVNVLKYVENCPSIAANLLIEGYPLEVMDGAASDVPMVWIKEVFRCLESKIGSTTKLLTLSIMGIQSSGKSTLLNAMFGLQLAVSTGRCTKGVFLQLIPMPKDQFPFQYVLVFDTEGLRSNESRESMVTHEHDNQLATFVVGVGDITLINIRGENLTEVSDILEIVVHACIRMKKVHEHFELKQSCIFVHQDVADTNASNLLPGTLKLVKCLNEITNEAADQENLPNCHSFEKIIHFNHEKHVFYFPNLWRGTPPLCAINTDYSEKVDRLKKFIMSDISERRKTYFSVQDICLKVNDLWKAILSEDFVFSFRNGIELKAERMAESKFFDLHRKLEKTVSQFLLMDAESAFGNCEKEEDLEQVKSAIEDNLTEKIATSFENLQREWTDFIEDAPLRDIMIQWKENRLKQLKIYKNEQQSFAWKELDMIESRIRLEIRQRIILTPKEKEEWKYHANNIVEKCIEHPLDDDIQIAFEKLWSANLRQFHIETNVEALSIDDEIRKIVFQLFQNDTLYLKTELANFERHRTVDEFKETTYRFMKGCINEMDITERHVSGKRLNAERKIALTMANDLKKRYEQGKKRQLDLEIQADKKKREEEERKFKEEQDKRNQVIQDKKTALRIVDIIKKAILSRVTHYIQDELVSEILKMFDSSKRNLIKTVMERLARKDNFHNFLAYIHNPTSYVNRFIEIYTDEKLFEDGKLYLECAIKQVGLFISSTKKAIEIVKDDPISDMEAWSKRLCLKSGFINITDLNFVRHIHVSNFEILTNFINDYLIDTEKSCFVHFRGISRFSVNWNNPKPYQKIFDRLWGCEKQCPFCSEPCEKTTKYHQNCHTCFKHKFNGVSGWHWESTDILCIDTCDANVASDLSFYCNKYGFSCTEDKHHNLHKYRNYKTFDPTWKIESDDDLSSSRYWIWYICRFEEEIKSRYNVKYPELPFHWRMITLNEAIQSLNYY